MFQDCYILMKLAYNTSILIFIFIIQRHYVILASCTYRSDLFLLPEQKQKCNTIPLRQVLVKLRFVFILDERFQ